MTDLKGELASLKIDRKRPHSSAWRWPLLLLIPVVVVLLGLYAWRAQQTFTAPEVTTTTAAVSRDVAPSAGTPVLTASGYVVARRKAVVSAKIQGRLSELRVEEGSVVRAGEVLARLESIDYEASVQRCARGRAAGRGGPRREPAPAATRRGPHPPERAGRRPARRGREPRADRRGGARAGQGRPGLQRGAAAEHADPRAFRRRRREEDGRGRARASRRSRRG